MSPIVVLIKVHLGINAVMKRGINLLDQLKISKDIKKLLRSITNITKSEVRSLSFSKFLLGAGMLASVKAHSYQTEFLVCQSDSVVVTTKNPTLRAHEYIVRLSQYDGNTILFETIQNFLRKDEVVEMRLTKERAILIEEKGIISVKGREWAIAISTEKNRASLYNMNPDINEVPMFCLSPELN